MGAEEDHPTHKPEGGQVIPDENPHIYKPPTSYTIGASHLSQPLVSIRQLKAHLSLLRAFKGLEASVLVRKRELPEEVEGLPDDKRWTWFVGLAVERFQIWPTTLVPNQDVDAWIEENIPPIDVLMVWHAYLLNPSWYFEDTERMTILKELKDVEDRLLILLIKARDINSFQPSPHRLTEWERTTRMPFNPVDAMCVLSDRYVECPQCNATVDVPLMTLDDFGYLQHKFSHQCNNCGFNITRENLAVNKLARDVVGNHDSRIYQKQYGIYVAGTLYSQLRLRDTNLAKTVLSALQSNGMFSKGKPPVKTELEARRKVLSKSAGSTAQIYAAVQKALSGGRRVNRIMSSYTDDRPFSIDLIGAVTRQSSFVDKMHNFAWTEPTYFDDAVDKVVLVHAIARYHAFLDLMTSSSTSFFVPTLDIDLVWHTHQMMGGKYADDCMKHVRCFIDHNDKVEGSYLTTPFDLNIRAWQQRFSVPYMHCGCPLPGDTIGQRLGRLTQHLRFMPEGSPDPPHHSDALSATHPSEHNSVSGSNDVNVNEQSRQKRLDKIETRRERDARLVEKGKMDKREYDRGADHDHAFLYPVPFYSPPAISCGSVPFVAAGSVGGCAVGARRCSSAGCGGECGAAGCGGVGDGRGPSGGGDAAAAGALRGLLPFV